MTIYSTGDNWLPGEFPAILAIGDSWFWYPRNNLLGAIARRSDELHDGYQHMMRLGQSGALLLDYVDLPGRPGRFAAELRENLEEKNLRYYSALFVSGAGNDSQRYDLCIKSNCSAAATPADCIDPKGLQRLITDITRDIGIVLHEAIAAFHGLGRTPKVFLHGYDYSVPDGRGFTLAGLALSGPWLKPILDRCSVREDLQFRCQVVKLLIDRLNDALQQYARPDAGIFVVDSRGTLSSGANYQDDWDNEIHPTTSGFDKIVRQRWMPLLKAANIAK